MKISIGSGFNKRLGYRQWIDHPMAAIPVNSSLGQIIGLNVVPASDGSGNYVWVVRLDNATIDIGTVDVEQTYLVSAPVLSNGDTTGFLSDIRGNLKVNLAAAQPGVTVGAVNQGDPGNIPWPVTVDSMPPITLGPLPAGTNPIGGVYQAPTASASFAIMPGSSPAWENSRILKTSAGNLYSLNIITGSVGGFLMTFNATTVPADGPVTPVECVPVSANSFATLSAYGCPPEHYSNGIVVVFSTTGPFVKTTTSQYGRGPYGRGPYSAAPKAVFKWSIV